ncbi:putative SNF2 family N-terminal domain containing protein [Klebsormidium nitens]|uniref:DNA helicase n=1 Tax=Klebsormidium nitens TaxID=105231 RepID=A0A1Y1I1U2_KLENI|nr:putative SNF2 family N-terminal domain containing protein [Klebsormidium nitens]|eukprot:GAQ84884.1 putative SNF2 family N-terminal domain containing protein [Klebsormidium nitens]
MDSSGGTNHASAGATGQGEIIILDSESPLREQKRSRKKQNMEEQNKGGESKTRRRVGKSELQALGQAGLQGGVGRSTRSRQEPKSPRQLRLALRKAGPTNRNAALPALDLNAASQGGAGKSNGSPPGKRLTPRSPVGSPRWQSPGRQGGPRSPVGTPRLQSTKEACLALPASPKPQGGSPRDPSMVVRFNLKQGMRGLAGEGSDAKPRVSETPRRQGLARATVKPDDETDLESEGDEGLKMETGRQKRDGGSGRHGDCQGRASRKGSIAVDGSGQGVDGDLDRKGPRVRSVHDLMGAERKDRPKLRVRIVSPPSGGGLGGSRSPGDGGGAQGASLRQGERPPGKKRKRPRDGEPPKIEIRIKRKHLQGRKGPEGGETGGGSAVLMDEESFPESRELADVQKQDEQAGMTESESEFGASLEKGELQSREDGLKTRGEDRLADGKKRKKKKGFVSGQARGGSKLRPQSASFGMSADEAGSAGDLVELLGNYVPPVKSASAKPRPSVREKLKTDAEIMARANEILQRQAVIALGGKIQPSTEPPRPLPAGAVAGKSHWEHLLAEMTWLAKDFEKERRWKLGQAKRWALKASKVQLDVEARDQKRVRDEESRVRKLASGIAKEVRKFWVKIEKLVQYKHSALAEETKKKALDKHLDFLVGQTERYSTMLAADLQGRPGTGTSKGSAGAEAEQGTSRGSGDEQGPARGSGGRVEASGKPGKSRLALTNGSLDMWSGEEEAKQQEGGDDGGAHEAVADGGAKQGRSEGGGRVAHADGDDDFEVGEDEQEEDDESTLEAEIAEEEAGYADEMDALKAESELPIEELLRRYQAMETDDEFRDSSDRRSDSDTPEPVPTRKRKAGEAGVNAPRPKRARRPVKASAQREHSEVMDGGKDEEEEYQGDDEGGDDEATLEEEEKLAQQSGDLGGDDELAMLQQESELTVEELLARYKGMRDEESAEEESSGERSSQAEDESGSGEEESEASDHDEPSDVPNHTEVSPESGVEEVQTDLTTGRGAGARTRARRKGGRSQREKRGGETRKCLGCLRFWEGGGEEDGDTEAGLLAVRRAAAKRGERAKMRSGVEEEGGGSGGIVGVERSSRGDEDGREAGRKASEKEGTVVEDGGVSPEEKAAPGRNGIIEKEAGEREEEGMRSENDGKGLETNQGVRDLGETSVAEGEKAEARGVNTGRSEEKPEGAAVELRKGQTGAEEKESDAMEIEVKNEAEGAVSEKAVGAEKTEGKAKITEGGAKDTGRNAAETEVGCKVTGLAEWGAKESAGKVEEEEADDFDEGSGQDRLKNAAAAAMAAQPTGYTLSTTQVRTKVPFLLKHSLREYQHIGLDWLVTMYEKRLNGILADEMGLGKTIQTIALLAYLACEKGIWGPHLIVVPTSVMLNWETELKKWCPAFKVLTYFGSAKERKAKRQGWSKPNSFHVCITTYRLVIQDQKMFKRKKWRYLILDEAHMIKNWRSQRWQVLLNFNSKRRILLTGTPLQNDLMELWSLMHFLMPHVFQSHQEFRDWFSNPLNGMVEGAEQINKELVERLHSILRPFLLRRLKQDVEKQLPGKFEHVIKCRLSKRQRNLYEDFMASSDTQATLASGNFLGLINVLMQLRKVCNHPDLFEGRPIVSAYDMPQISPQLSSDVINALKPHPLTSLDLDALNMRLIDLEGMHQWEAEEICQLATPRPLIEEIDGPEKPASAVPVVETPGNVPTANETEGERAASGNGASTSSTGPSPGRPRTLLEEIRDAIEAKRLQRKKDTLAFLASLNVRRCNRRPVFGADVRAAVEVVPPALTVTRLTANPARYLDYPNALAELVVSPEGRCEKAQDLVETFVFAIPRARAPPPRPWCSHPGVSEQLASETREVMLSREVAPLLTPLRQAIVRRQLFFPDRRLLQYDCGKLQELAELLRKLKAGGHRALIFTQMTRMLDHLESFINLYGYTYMRLDGSTKPEQRQILMQRFNTNPKIFLFILSTRSGGVGVNLVGADTVIFYDSDWNPAMDLQAQDRCHRIGQTREVHIYRLVCESTIEENILKKANQKRALDDLVIQSGGYNTDFFKKLDPMELFGGAAPTHAAVPPAGGVPAERADVPAEPAEPAPAEPTNAEVEAALGRAEDEEDYAALKRAEQEEAQDAAEFNEEGGPVADDDEEGGAAKGAEGPPAKGGEVAVIEEEGDVLRDLKQRAAAAGKDGNFSFEDQLRPIERYAMHYLEDVFGVVDPQAAQAEVDFEQKEWELDQLEKLKDQQEAEVDDDEEQIVFTDWDTEQADDAYRRQVELAAQWEEERIQAEIEAELEAERREAERKKAEEAAAEERRQRILRKTAKQEERVRFLAQQKEEEAARREQERAEAAARRHARGSSHSGDDTPIDGMRSPSQRKRKVPKYLDEFVEDEEGTRLTPTLTAGGSNEPFSGPPGKKNKKKKLSELGAPSLREDWSFDFGYPWENASLGESGPLDLDGSRDTVQKKASAAGGVFTLPSSGTLHKPSQTLELFRRRKAEFERSRGGRDFTPWKHAEDVILCSAVVELGVNWDVASDVLAGVPDLGPHRGRKRSPEQCRERYAALMKAHGVAPADSDSVPAVKDLTPAVGPSKPAGEVPATAVGVQAEGNDAEGAETERKSEAASGSAVDSGGLSKPLELNLPPAGEPPSVVSTSAPDQGGVVPAISTDGVKKPDETAEPPQSVRPESPFTPQPAITEEQAKLLLERVTSSPGDVVVALPPDFENAVRASQRHPQTLSKTTQPPAAPVPSPEGLGFIRVDQESAAVVSANHVAPHPSHRAAGKDAFETLARLAGRPISEREPGLSPGLEQDLGWVTSFAAQPPQPKLVDLNASPADSDRTETPPLQPSSLPAALLTSSQTIVGQQLGFSKPEPTQPSQAGPPLPAQQTLPPTTEQEPKPDFNPVRQFLTQAADLGRLARAEVSDSDEEELAAATAGFADVVDPAADVSVVGGDVSRPGEGLAGWMELLPKVEEPKDLGAVALKKGEVAEGRYRVAANLALKGDITDWAEGAMTAFSAEPEAAPLPKKAPAKKKEPKEPKPAKPRKKLRQGEEDLEDIPINKIKLKVSKGSKPLGRPRKSPAPPGGAAKAANGPPIQAAHPSGGVAKAADGTPVNMSGLVGKLGGVVTSYTGSGDVSRGWGQGGGERSVAPSNGSAPAGAGAGVGALGLAPGLLQGQANSVLSGGVTAATNLASPGANLQRINVSGGDAQAGFSPSDSPPIAALARKPLGGGLLPKPAKKKTGLGDGQGDGNRQFATVHRGRGRGVSEGGRGRGGRGRGRGRGLGSDVSGRLFDSNDKPPPSPSAGTVSPFGGVQNLLQGVPVKPDGFAQGRPLTAVAPSGGVVAGQKAAPLSAGLHSFGPSFGAEGRASVDGSSFRGGDLAANQGGGQSTSQSIRMRLERSLDPRQEAQPLGAKGGHAADWTGGLRAPPSFRGLASPTAIPEHRKKSAVPVLDLNAEPKSPGGVKKRPPPSALLNEDTPLQLVIDRAAGKKAGDRPRPGGAVSLQGGTVSGQGVPVPEHGATARGGIARPSGSVSSSAKGEGTAERGIAQGKSVDFAKTAHSPPEEAKTFRPSAETNQRSPSWPGPPLAEQRHSFAGTTQTAPHSGGERGPPKSSPPQQRVTFSGSAQHEARGFGGPVERRADLPPGYSGSGAGVAVPSKAFSGQQRTESFSPDRNRSSGFADRGLGVNPRGSPQQRVHSGGRGGMQTNPPEASLPGGPLFGYQQPPQPPPFSAPQPTPPWMTSPPRAPQTSPPRMTSPYRSPPRVTSPYRHPQASPTNRLTSHQSPPGRGPVVTGGALRVAGETRNWAGHGALSDGEDELPEFVLPEPFSNRPNFPTLPNPGAGTAPPPPYYGGQPPVPNPHQDMRGPVRFLGRSDNAPDDGLPPGFGRPQNPPPQPRDLDLPPGFGR